MANISSSICGLRSGGSSGPLNLNFAGLKKAKRLMLGERTDGFGGKLCKGKLLKNLYVCLNNIIIVIQLSAASMHISLGCLRRNI